MSDDIVVEAILLYPIKSLDPVTVSQARLLPSGALDHDREFALFDESGKWVNGKRDPRIHRVRSEYDLNRLRVTLGDRERAGSKSFHLVEDRHEIEQWFGQLFGFKVFLQRNTVTGFPDDLESPGPTIVGSATLREVGSWFGMPDVREIRRRFRPNIVLKTGAPFWEDRLFGGPGVAVEFHIGDVPVRGINPCQRCAVPSRDPLTGDVVPDFQRIFAANRAETLPAWTSRSRFNHYYRLGVNTRVPSTEAGKPLHTGDPVRL